MRITLALTALALLSACAGKLDYVRPAASLAPGLNVKVIQKPRDVVWAEAIPALGKNFYVINNLDKASGLVNLSYTGDPEKYVDCGRITSFVKSAQGERTYDFAGARAQQIYEVMLPGIGLFSLNRIMSLEGRVNLIFEEVGANATRVTANTRYVITRNQTVRSAGGGIPQTSTDSINFNSGLRASFPANRDGQAAECAATGTLESEILALVR